MAVHLTLETQAGFSVTPLTRSSQGRGLQFSELVLTSKTSKGKQSHTRDLWPNLLLEKFKIQRGNDLTGTMMGNLISCEAREHSEVLGPLAPLPL